MLVVHYAIPMLINSKLLLYLNDNFVLFRVGGHSIFEDFVLLAGCLNIIIFQYAMAIEYLHIWPRHEFMLIALPNLVSGRFV